MADISVTASAVRGTKSLAGTAGASLTAGEVVHADANGQLQPSDSNDSSNNSVAGITLHAAGSGQPMLVHGQGALTINSVLTAGTFYYLSATPGAICPFADLTTGSRVIQIGYAISTTVLNVNIVDTGVTL